MTNCKSNDYKITVVNYYLVEDAKNKTRKVNKIYKYWFINNQRFSKA